MTTANGPAGAEQAAHVVPPIPAHMFIALASTAATAN
jgi:hypothetical protein